LGNRSRTKRLTDIAARAAENPSGRITEVFATSAEREGAFRFIANENIAPHEIAAAAGRACARACDGDEFVFAPVDASSLSLPGPTKARALGSVGNHLRGRHGLHAMSAIAVSADGTPMGLLAQRLWSRAHEPVVGRSRRNRPLDAKETQHWLRVVEDACRRWDETGASGRIWFQLDRGGDFWQMLHWATQQKTHWTTLRVAYDRRVIGDELDYLWPHMRRQRVLGFYELDIPATATRKARRGRFQLRAAPVTIWTRARPSKAHLALPLTAVWARELGTTPRGEKPLEWMLFTTAPVRSFADAKRVLFGYTRRWRIEEFHKTWKSTCRVEETQLRSANRVARWATILAAVATRIEHLKHVARAVPDTAASAEFSHDELQAVLLLKRHKLAAGETPNVALVVQWIAELGGYTGKSSGGPPGGITIGRGLERISAVALALQNQRELQKT
jgi:hypothetical protein